MQQQDIARYFRAAHPNLSWMMATQRRVLWEAPPGLEAPQRQSRAAGWALEGRVEGTGSASGVTDTAWGTNPPQSEQSLDAINLCYK